MKKSNLLVLLSLLFSSVLLFSSYHSQERILSFDETITIHNDGWMDVEEKITVNATGNAIRRGIVRQIPTKHHVYGYLNYRPIIKLRSILKNNKPASYHTQKSSNSLDIFIGSSSKYIPPGIYTYTISYSTRKHLLFFKDHDELYWNVTGSYWKFIIDKASVTINLPEGIQEKDITVAAYTGKVGKQDKDYHVNKSGNTVTFNSTKPIYPGSDFTVAVGWPKGFVQEPVFAWELIKDNIAWLVFLFVFLMIAILICLAYLSKDRIKSGVVIPLFKPPTGYNPSMCRYILKRKFDNVSFASELVRMAVDGILTIEVVKTSFGFSKKYILKTTGVEEKADELQKKAALKLFSKNKEIELSQKNGKVVLRVWDMFKIFAYKNINKYFTIPVTLLIIEVIAIGVVILFGLYSDPEPIFYFITIFLFFMTLIITYKLLSGYTLQGQKIADEVKGFQLFLQTVETERLKEMVSVNKSPDLYERFLPYAIALGAEYNWTKSFAPLFDQLKDTDQAYQPIWFYGGSYKDFSTGSFSSSLSSFTSNMSTSSFGSSSGSSGGGSSGGGGGGGGGGGW